MKLDKRHLIASLVLLAGSIVYNIYVYMGPSTASRPVAADDQVGAAAVSGGGAPAGAAAVDPMRVPAPPDVALDELPAWSRTPFAHVKPVQPLEPVVAGAAPQVEPEEPDVVVAAILHAADRRVAMVNGRIVRVGDKVGVVTIVDILPTAIVVESPMRGRRTLDLQPPRSGERRP